MLVRFDQLYGLTAGTYDPGCHRIGPFSWKKPSRLLQPGPPLSLRAAYGETEHV